jgi:hypothetical protein
MRDPWPMCLCLTRSLPVLRIPGWASHLEELVLAHTQLLSLGGSQRAAGEYEILCLGQSQDARSALSTTSARDYAKFRLGQTNLRDGMAFKLPGEHEHVSVRLGTYNWGDLCEGVHIPATRKSHARASSNPPPRAGPSMAAMVGMGRLSSFPSAARKSARNLET